MLFKIHFLLLLTLFPRILSAQTDSTTHELRHVGNPMVQVSVPSPPGWVNDFERLFIGEEIQVLDSIIRAYKSQTSIEIAIVTLDTSFTSAEEFDDYTLKIANSWGVGELKRDNGILIAISKSHRKMRIHNGYGIEKLISDPETKEIIDRYFIPAFKKGDYYSGTLKGIKKLIELLDSKLK